jgi:hypothetical protein
MRIIEMFKRSQTPQHTPSSRHRHPDRHVMTP